MRRNGFTATARKLAESEKIVVLTLHQAEGLDFGGVIAKLVVVTQVWQIQLRSVTVRLERTDVPPDTFLGQVGGDGPESVLYRDGEAWWTLRQLAHDILAARATSFNVFMKLCRGSFARPQALIASSSSNFLCTSPRRFSCTVRECRG